MPIIDTRGLFSCCVKSLKGRPSDPWPVEEELYPCELCSGIMIWEGGAWRFHWRALQGWPFNVFDVLLRDDKASRQALMDRLEAQFALQRERFPG